MALQALWAPETQFQNKNGSLLVFGKIYVQYRGRSQLAKTYRDSDGAYQNTNPLLTDNDGRVLCYADDSFSYTAVVCDFYGNELFSFDPIPCGSGSGSGSSTGSSAQHWIGINGQTQQVSRNTYTRLKLPSGLDNVDYEGDFVLGTIKGSGTEMVLKEGLYLVNTVIRFKQSSDDLTNTLSNVIVHTRDFDTPNIQEVGAVVRDEAGPDASEDIHTITLTYIRHVSEDDAGSDRIKFAVETPNTWTECYIQNLQIAKLGSSVGGGGSASIYSPGDYISIENDTISVTGIEPENYATHDELQSATSAFITSADLPDLSEYATEQWVLDKQYITSADIPDIPDDLVTSAELSQTSGLIEQDIADLTSAISEALADKMDKSYSADFYPRYDNPEGYLTSVPSEYVTESEMSGYVLDHTSAFITSADLPDLSDYATEQYVQDYTSGFITSADLPDVSDMATKTWVTDQHYITSADIPDIPDDVVTSGELATVSGEIVNQIPSLDGYATETYVTEHTSAFVTSADLPDISDMATETWVSGQGYLKNLFQAEYGVTTFAEILEAVYNKKTVYCLIPAWGHTSGRMAFLAYVNISDPIAASNFFEFQYYRSNSTESANDSVFVYQVKPNNTWTTTERVAGNVSDWKAKSGRTKILNKPDLSIYATNSRMEEYVTSQVSGKQDQLTFSYDASDKINAINGSALAGEGGGTTYSAGDNIDITNDVISVSDTSQLIAGDNVSITASGNDYIISAQVPGTSGYVTEQEMNDAIQSATSAFITSADVPEYSAGQYIDITNKTISVSPVKSLVAGENVTISASGDNYVISSVGGGGGGTTYSAGQYVSIENDTISVTGLQPAGSYASEQYVQDYTSGFVDSTYVSEYVASQVSGKQDTLTFGYDSSDKINAINGSAIAGGGDVPEGVMVESELQYNAVGEISGYGESAIAQYGAEKQWLVHDDTIVHVTNSAQYAFGVNISATSQLMGVDQTVLWENSAGATTAFSLSEPVSGFDQLKIRFDEDGKGNRFGYMWCNDTSMSQIGAAGLNFLTNDTDDGIHINGARFTVSGNDLTMNYCTKKWISLTPSTSQAWGAISTLGTTKVYKIVGIGRKQSN